MFRSNPVGFHTALTPEVHANIIDAVYKVITPRQVARMARLSYKNLCNWLTRGLNDVETGESTVYAQLFLDFEAKLSEVVQEFIHSIRNRETNWQAPYELLKVAAREDFGADVTEFKELKELYAKLLEDVKRITDQPAIQTEFKPQGEGNG